eukprot:Blabericola_migrator_1__5628@NODE_285_length_10382_cov_182_229956_g235_i0_p8_GENE_NODE_285_length_10382_cov_182_229956_g235_i0NODE_285_length_10382_cov_182_229956_g235_i0_p8_ORF_typecomplete_len127_score16_28Rpp20/PF12328_8/0_019_NODE_285_length_10382_cov_182_229956_g235_i0423803
MSTERCFVEALPLPHANPRTRDIYITRRHPLIVYFKRLKHLLLFYTQSEDDTTRPCVRIFGAGSAVKGAMMLFSDAMKEFPHLIVSHRVQLGTANSTDIDLETDEIVEGRVVSTIQIDIFVRTSGH